MVLGSVFVSVTFCLLCGFYTSFAEEELKVVCYFINWDSNFGPQDVDPFLCTHLNYAFAILDNETLTLKPGDETVDVRNRLYERTLALRNQNPKLRILISLGGWGDSEHSEKYSRMITSKESRENFINTTINFLDTYGFDGIDLDWEYPVCWWQNCSKGPESDKENFSKLTQELRLAFDQHDPPLLVTAAISAVKPVIDDSYDIEQLNTWLHFINVMTYDLQSDTNGNRTVHQAAMYNSKGSMRSYLNVNFTMNYLVEKGASKDKLVMGIPAYGRWFNLLNAEEHDLGAPTASSSAGYISYTSICKGIKDGEWTAVRDPEAGPYAYGGLKWVGYDDPLSFAEKGRYVKDNGFGGVMTWDLTTDDYRSECCEVKHPLVKSMVYGLFGNGTSPESMGCS